MPPQNDITMTAEPKEETKEKKGFKATLRALSPGRTRSGDAEGKPDKKDKKADKKDKKEKKIEAVKDKENAENTIEGEGEAKVKTTWKGKKARSEYQAEIDDLNAKIAELDGIEADRDRLKTKAYQLAQEINSFKGWLAQAPRH